MFGSLTTFIYVSFVAFLFVIRILFFFNDAINLIKGYLFNNEIGIKKYINIFAGIAWLIFIFCFWMFLLYAGYELVNIYLNK